MKKSLSPPNFQNLTDTLNEIFTASTKAALSVDDRAEISRSSKDRAAHYQCNSAMKLGKKLGKNPREIATLLIENIFDPLGLILNSEIAGPGFINITIDPKYLSNQLNEIFLDPRLGVPLVKTIERVVCEFSSPNIAKAMHVGHLRSTIIGDCLARLLEFLGHDVIRLNHIGDWGTQFGMLIAYLKTNQKDLLDGKKTADIESLMQWYKDSKKEFDENPKFKKEAQEEVVKLQSGDESSLKAWANICEISREAFDEIYNTLGVSIEERGESFYNPFLPTVISDFEKANLVKINDGAKCVFLDGFSNKEGNPLPLIIQKRDGGYNYATTDLAGFHYRIEKDKAQRIIVVTDSGQATHFRMVEEASEQVGYIDHEKVQFNHVPFGLVLAPDGKKFKTRSGETERLKDLLDEAVSKARAILEERGVDNLDEAAKILGIGSVKYADLSCNRIKDYTFSYERMLQFEGNTATFILYAFVRIQSIKRKIDIDIETVLDDSEINLLHATEIALGMHIRQFGETLRSMDTELLPNRLTDYLFNLAEAFHAFFRDCQVQGDPQQNSRLLLIELTARILEKGLSILGIGTLTKM